MNGFLMERGWRGHKLFRGASYTRGEAWLWLIETACWQPMEFDIKGKSVRLERSQLCASRQQMAKQFKWSESAVERFLTRLETERMIERETGHGKTIITVCNYNKYQLTPKGSGQEDGQQPEQEADRNRTAKEEGKEGKQEKNNNDYAFFGQVIRLIPGDFNRWQSAYSDLDLKALLQSRDDWFRDQPPEHQKRWFQSTSNWLASKQQAASTEMAEKKDPWANLEMPIV